jgi:DNA-directed RNA polymerase subunit L
MSKKKSTVDINVREVSYIKPNKFTSSQLVLEFTGKDVNYVIANTLRRVSYDDIPTYAFEYVNIEHNNSKAFDNDYMAVRLRQLPVYDIKNDLYYLHPKYWQNIDYYDKNREKHESEQLIEGTINAFNNTNELMNVTTKDMNYYIDGKQVEYPHRFPDEPILLIELLPNQTFKCQLKAFLGVGERDSIWFGSKLAYYETDDENPNKILFTIESTGQMGEYEVLTKCCMLIKLKLDSIGREIDQRVKTKEIKIAPTIFFELVNEDHTIGNLINNALQDHPYIAYAGVSKPDHLIKQIKFKMTCSDDVSSPIQPLFEVIDYLKGVFSSLGSQFAKLGNVNLHDNYGIEGDSKGTKK